MQESKINKIYILKSLLSTLVVLTIVTIIAVVLFLLSVEVFTGVIIWLVFILSGSIIGSLVLVLRVLFFSYALGDDFIIVRQGIISRSEKHVPYSVIQDVIVRQDIFDRILGISTLIVENASMGGAMPMSSGRYGGNSNAYANQAMLQNMPGMYGNMLVITGLVRADALKLRDVVLEKTKTMVAGSKQSEL